MFLLIFCLAFTSGSVAMRVSLTNDGPAVRGSNVTFTATVSGYDGSALEFVYWDFAQPQHRTEIRLSSNISTWTVEYTRDLYDPGEYMVRVELRKYLYAFYIYVDSATTTLNLTDSLNGNLVLSQNNTERQNTFVAVNETVSHIIRLPKQEKQFLDTNSSSIVTYWFIDCMFVGITTDYALNYTYSNVMGSHLIDALVVADHNPLPPLPTTTTTTTSTTTTTTTTTTTQKPPTTKPPDTPATNSTTSKATTVPETITLTPTTTAEPNTNATQPQHKVSKRAVSNKTTFKHEISALDNFICKNTVVPIGNSYTYGHYQETIGVREPIATPVNITGLNWLQHEDLMNLKVSYNGSPPFNYCAIYKVGQYNVTGNETCPGNKIKTVSNSFPLVHYFSDADQHTVVVIIENDIGKVVTRATINIYKVSVHSQLSVIVVPVVFCLIAVILVIFGIAYFQHRSRYTIEVADFDFGQQNHFDYKTFMERLRDSFRNAFKFGQSDDTEALTNNTRYDSMP